MQKGSERKVSNSVLVTTSKALVTSSDALVTSRKEWIEFLFLANIVPSRMARSPYWRPCSVRSDARSPYWRPCYYEWTWGANGEQERSSWQGLQKKQDLEGLQVVWSSLCTFFPKGVYWLCVSPRAPTAFPPEGPWAGPPTSSGRAAWSPGRARGKHQQTQQ